MRILKTNTAVRIVVGPLVNISDGYSLVASATVTGIEINMWHEHDDGSAPTLTIDGVNPTASGGSNDMVALAHGYYDLELTDTQTNFIGRAKFSMFDADVFLPYFEDFLVLPANVFDSLKGDDLLDVSTVQWTGTAVHSPGTAGVPIVEIHDAQTPAVNVTQFGGSNGTFASGIPAVNATQLAGTAYASADLSATMKSSVTAAVPTTAQIATGVWQDATAGDFTTASSIGKALYINNVAPGGSGGHMISGSNAGTTTLAALTVTGATTLTGQVTGTNASNDLRGISVNMIKDQSVTCTTGVTINANVGTTQPINFTGTSSSALVKSDVVDFGGSAGTFSSGRPEVNTTHLAGTAYASADLSTTMKNSINAEVDTALNTEIPASNTANSVNDVLLDVLTSKIDTIDGIVDDIHGTDLPAVKTDTAAILLDTGTDGVVLKAAGLDADAVDEILDEVVEGTVTVRQALRLMMSVLTGKSSGGGTATLVFRDIGDTKNRISCTVDADGNRLAVGTRDGS